MKIPDTFDTVIIDGDWLLYRISCSGENTYIEVKESPNSTPIRYKNITTLRSTLPKSEHSQVYTDYIIEEKKELKSLDAKPKAIMSLKAKIAKIKRETGAKKCILAIGGDNNFRDEIPLPVPYKGQRRGKSKPLLFHYLKDHILKYENVVVAHGQEADDLLSINQYSHCQSGLCVSSTLDKDNRSIPGYLHNPETGEVVYISGLGSCQLIDKSSKKQLFGYGRCWEYIQWIVGDPVDYYHPQDLLSKDCISNHRSNLTKVKTKLNHTFVYNKVKTFTTDKEWLQLIHDIYYDWYKDIKWYLTHDNKRITNIDYIDILQCYVDCAHMRRWENDRVDIRQVFKKQGII